MLTLDKVYRASYALKGTARKTDMIHAYNVVKGEKIYLKTENLQTTGSFKLRGAYYKISCLTEEERARGIVACSAGNHAQGVALAAQKYGIPVTICMPDGAPISKVEATKSYGAKVELVGETYDDAFDHARRLQEETGCVFIHPFDDEDVIAGQGTIGLEILEQLPDVENIVVPIGGGGLISGIAYVVKKLKPTVKVIGVQAAAAASMVNSVNRHEILTLPSVRTFADGIAVKTPGDITYDIVENYVDELVTVTEDEIATAILALMERQKLVCEGAGAVAVAAVLFNKIDIEDTTTCCVLSGGNIDVNILSRVISRGLLKTGRTADLTINLMDKPGQLLGVSSIISKHGGNVIGVFYDQGEEEMAVNSCVLRIKMETRDGAQIEEIKEALRAAGFSLIDTMYQY
ncbi:MAG: threonine ammonia-lyase [Eubacteriales bacterium]|nr:threonine ammonia-lyase [Eubacteriales bacterium]